MRNVSCSHSYGSCSQRPERKASATLALFTGWTLAAALGLFMVTCAMACVEGFLAMPLFMATLTMALVERFLPPFFLLEREDGEDPEGGEGEGFKTSETDLKTMGIVFFPAVIGHQLMLRPACHLTKPTHTKNATWTQPICIPFPAKQWRAVSDTGFVNLSRWMP